MTASTGLNQKLVKRLLLVVAGLLSASAAMADSVPEKVLRLGPLARAAAITFLLINKRHLCLAKDVALIIARLVYCSFREPVWEEAASLR